MSSVEFIAHIRASDGAEQRLVDHLKEVQALAEEIGQKIGLPHVTGLAGMLHDMGGKFSHAFQEYIREAAANPENPPKRGEVWTILRQGGQIFTGAFSSRGGSHYIYFNRVCGQCHFHTSWAIIRYGRRRGGAIAFYEEMGS